MNDSERISILLATIISNAPSAVIQLGHCDLFWNDTVFEVQVSIEGGGVITHQFPLGRNAMDFVLRYEARMNEVITKDDERK